MRRAIAVFDADSSSIRFALFEAGGSDAPLFRGVLEQIGIAPRLRVARPGGEILTEEQWASDGFDHKVATREVLSVALDLARQTPVVAVGHRVAHGGLTYSAPVQIDRQVLAALAALNAFAPQRQPHNLAPIQAILETAPYMLQVACFDTAFHCDQPPVAQSYALPRRFSEAGVRRYGFDGLAYEYVAARLAEIAPAAAAGRIVIARLGNSASLCAVRAGRSVAATTGFTAFDGLMMGTRCGALDPGVLIHLMDAYGLGPRELETVINRQSGLLGVSGLSSDMGELRASGRPAAAEAIDLFVYRIVREVGSMAAALGGLDGLVFTGGLGESDAETRAAVAKGCRWLGLELDPTRNALGAGTISPLDAPIACWVIPTDEERMVAHHTKAVLNGAAPLSA